MPLSQLKPGQEGKIIEIVGGSGVGRRLDAMGVRVGKKVKRISRGLMRGPVVFEIDGMQMALGLGIAEKILVKILR
ncbi:MAG TPA: ferrous iron transport protein A [Candidatus Peregrinibacteria bacterium]|nr:ferrous iron transport protein A [Candidatus Peregrinibacteria bacterium]